MRPRVVVEHTFYRVLVEWGPPKIRLQLPPQYGVRLLAWGCDPAGSWWALITWERFIAHHFEAPRQLWCTAWTAARYVERMEHEDYGRVPRVRKRAILHRMQHVAAIAAINTHENASRSSI